ncbi:hypothetical protein PMIT1327_00657 [Prochlorococcus marinus str. MIT 1327]|nr:hypothetical protein PMIT1312_00997 [Prochlorococcus marinus str. MIT 1312]KZR83000.1 hypothetical protein PMIT1327_00657 [Prochlorococcus marinus str. MIT 1327]
MVRNIPVEALVDQLNQEFDRSIVADGLLDIYPT